jgi:hypothetical protein
VVAVADGGIGDVGMTMGLTVELGGVAEVVADVEDVEEDDVNVVDILGCLLFVCRRVCRSVWW